MKTLGVLLLLNLFNTPSLLGQNLEADRLVHRNEMSHPIDLNSIANARDTGVILTLGQSNAANYGQGPYPIKHTFYELKGEKISVAQDPLTGADGSGTSVWTRLGDLLIERQVFKNVVFIPIAIGSTEIACWTSGDCNKKLTEVLKSLNKLNIKVNYIIWHQGESDNLKNTSFEEYKNSLTLIKNQIFENMGNTPFIVSIASYHPEMIGKKHQGRDESIRKAQQAFITENENIIKGPDTDQYDKVYHRHDGVHFSRQGLDIFAQELFDIIAGSQRLTTYYK